MASHQFGILRDAPVPGERFDAYEPERCRSLLSVDDEWIEPLLPRFLAVRCFCHTLDIPCRGLVYTGITLIPPGSLGEAAAITSGVPALRALTELFRQAEQENKFVLHYGL